MESLVPPEDTVLLPIRCITCGAFGYKKKVDEYRRLVEQGVDAREAMERTGLTGRYCCMLTVLTPSVLPLGPLVNPTTMQETYVDQRQQRQNNVLIEQIVGNSRPTTVTSIRLFNNVSTTTNVNTNILAIPRLDYRK